MDAAGVVFTIDATPAEAGAKRGITAIDQLDARIDRFVQNAVRVNGVVLSALSLSGVVERANREFAQIEAAFTAHQRRIGQLGKQGTGSGGSTPRASRATSSDADVVAQQKAADATLRNEQAVARLLQAQGKQEEAIKTLQLALNNFTGSAIQATRAQIQLTNLQNDYANSPLIGAVRGQASALSELHNEGRQAATTLAETARAADAAGANLATAVNGTQAETQALHQMGDAQTLASKNAETLALAIRDIAGSETESSFRRLIGFLGGLTSIFSDISSGLFFLKSQGGKARASDLAEAESSAADALAATQSIVRGAQKGLDIVQKLKTEGIGALKDVFTVPESIQQGASTISQTVAKVADVTQTVAKGAETAKQELQQATQSAKEFVQSVRSTTGNTVSAPSGDLLERLRIANENSLAAFKSLEVEERAARRRRQLAEETSAVERERQSKIRAQLEENARVRAKTIGQEMSELRAAETLRAKLAAEEANRQRRLNQLRVQAQREQEAQRALPLGERVRQVVVRFIKDERGEADFTTGFSNLLKAAEATSAKVKASFANLSKNLRVSFAETRDIGGSKSLFSGLEDGAGIIGVTTQKLSALGQRGSSIFAELGSTIKSTGINIGAFVGIVSVTTIGLVALVAAFAAAVPAVLALGAAGLQANAQLEQVRLGIASVVASVGTLKTSGGVKLEGVDALNASLPLAQKQLNALRVDALQTALEFKDIAPAFLQAIGPGLSAGLNLDQIRKTVVDVSQLIVPLTGNASQLGQELRSIFSGDIGPDSSVAKALGITKQAIDAAKEQGRLADFLNEKLKAASATGRLMANTFEAAASNLKEAGTVLASNVTEGLFDTLKNQINSQLPQIFSTAGGTVEIAPAFRGIADALSVIFNQAGVLASQVLGGLIQAAKDLSSFLSENKEQLEGIVKASVELTMGFGAVVFDVLKLLAVIIQMSGAFELILNLLQAVALVLRVIDGLLSPILDALGKVNDFVVGLSSRFRGTREEAELTRIALEETGRIKIDEAQGSTEQIRRLQEQIAAAAQLTGEQAKFNQEQERYKSILATLTPQQQAIIAAYGTQQERLSALKASLGSTLEAQQALIRAQQTQVAIAIAAQQAEIAAIQKKNAEIDKEIVLRDKLLRNGEKTKITFNPTGPESKPVIEDIAAAQAKLTQARNEGAKSLDGLNTKQAESIAKLRALVPALNQTEEALLSDLKAGRLSSEQYENLKKALDSTKTGAASATLVLNEQANAVDRLTDSLERLNKSANTEVDKRVRQIALTARTEAEAKAQVRQALKNDDDFFAAVDNKNRVSKNLEAAQSVIDPKQKRSSGGGGGGGRKELSELQQLQKQLREAEKDVSSFRNVSSEEFSLRIKLEDTRRFKSELEEILTLRRELNEPIAVALPSTKEGARVEIDRLKSLKEFREFEKSIGKTNPIAEAARATSEAFSEQLKTLDKLISDSLPKTEEATVTVTLAQNEFYQSLLRTNPALADYYKQQAIAADATIQAANAQKLFVGLQEELSGKLTGFQELTEAQTLALKLQRAEYAGLSDAQRQQLFDLANQIEQQAAAKDAQDAYKRQLEESQRAVETFGNTLSGLFQDLFERGPKAFFDNMLSTLKRTLAQMAASFATSKVLEFLGLKPKGGGSQSSGGGLLGGLFGGGNRQQGGGSQSPLGSLLSGGQSSPASFLTGGFAGGNPAQTIIGRQGGAGGFLSKIPLLGKLFGGGAAASGAGSTAASSAGGAAASGGAGGAAGLGALFSNPITAIATGALLAAPLLIKAADNKVLSKVLTIPFLISLFKNKDFQKFQKLVQGTYQIKVDSKQEGKALFASVKELGEQAFGKGSFGKKISETIQLKKAQEAIAGYGEATGQTDSPLVKKLIKKREIGDASAAENNFVRRATGGIVPGVDTGRDYVRALLRGGEFVTVPEVVQTQGRGRFDALNSGDARIVTNREIENLRKILQSAPTFGIFGKRLRDRILEQLNLRESLLPASFNRGYSDGGYVMPATQAFNTGGYVFPQTIAQQSQIEAATSRAQVSNVAQAVAIGAQSSQATNQREAVLMNEMRGNRVVMAKLVEVIGRLDGFDANTIVGMASPDAVARKTNEGYVSDSTLASQAQQNLGLRT